MTVVQEQPAGPPAAHAPRPPRIGVRIRERRLPAHAPLDLYTTARRRLGPDVYLFESPEGPWRDSGTAVVGFGRLAEIQVHARSVTVSGTEAVTGAVLRAADRIGMPALGPDSRAIAAPDQVWELLRAAQQGFTLETTRPEGEFSFGFLAAFGYGAAWHMEQLPARETSGPDIVLTLFSDTVHYAPDGSVRHLRAQSADFEPCRFDPADGIEAVGESAGVPRAPVPRSVHDSLTREEFLARAERCLEHIRVGDIYQIQIGHSIDVRTPLSPTDVYRRLRSRNPSPHLYLVPRAGDTLIGASPELLFRIDGSRIEMRPIAGTAPRGPDEDVNRAQVARMRASEKERAEHVMLVDLCRNDIGRVARTGSLDVPVQQTVETFSHVFHLVSVVEGELAEDTDVWAAVRAVFPAGTVTGTPKIRAMELIEELEHTPRDMYAGAVGLIDVRGPSRLALCIRTVVHDGIGYRTQACAGIVADSEPAAEWRETLHKMGAAHWALTGQELLP
ncbi:anthranilate synthase component I family protein [Streptomyces sp. VRA16 Mangrove soil]|uniref:anthranilate synthase component I family protein n=1 Tax=Streptomyces sp. VRA16 Mangrove soil TaxID=2817434 RepID=UPI001A9CF5D1|nr:anthranilate synthase component I family protein [Streptomyces sp. VRA16 Mangrove soil]MBO1334070.1 anthranilate synthase component I family protein [Streptomyces sp. VRA16 Mangrove soil]